MSVPGAVSHRLFLHGMSEYFGMLRNVTFSNAQHRDETALDHIMPHLLLSDAGYFQVSQMRDNPQYMDVDMLA